MLARKIIVEDLSSGNTFVDMVDILISARGMLNTPAWPDLEGLSNYQGKTIHSAKWDEQ